MNAGWAGHQQRALRLGGRVFAVEELIIMGIVNRTPDSFYDQGRTFRAHQAVSLAEHHLDNGAAIVDVGGVKAGHGEYVSAAEERDRVCEVIASLRARRPDAVISIDTWRSSVARDAVAAGANVINDAWEGHDPELVNVAAESGSGLVCTHAGHLPPRTDPSGARYDDVVTDVLETLTRLAQQAVDAGVRQDGILIDPGHDFGKTTAHSLEITRRLDELVRSGWPVLVAMSNKDFIGETLNQPVAARLPGTLGVTAVAAWLGARVFRSHNVESTRHVLDMVASVRADRPPASPRRGLPINIGHERAASTGPFTASGPALYCEAPAHQP